MTLWFNETIDGCSQGYQIKEFLFSQQSDFQKVEVFETVSHGRMMAIDGCVMISDADEFVYHEMISHVPVCYHGSPKKVVVIGGGDGGTVREILKHGCVEEVVLCEIDQVVIDAAFEYFPKVSSALNDSRVKIRVGDGIAYMRDHTPAELDVVIVDSTDPIGPGEGLFSRAFYESVAASLRSGGVMACQSESPWFESKLLQRITRNVGAGFKHQYPYLGLVPTYPRGAWTWTMASREEIEIGKFDSAAFASVEDSLSYLNRELMSAAFALPNFYKSKLEIES